MLVDGIIDTHCHWWHLDNPYAWLKSPVAPSMLGNYRSIQQRYTPKHFLQDVDKSQVSLKGAVHVQAGWNKDHPYQETQWVQAAAAEAKIPIAIIGFVDFSSRVWEAHLEHHQLYPSFRGIRQCLNWNEKAIYAGCDQDYLSNAGWQVGLKQFAKVASKNSLLFELQAYPNQLDQFKSLINNYPDFLIVIEHCGMPVIGGVEDRVYWLKQLRKLAELPNTFIKLSGLGMFFHDYNAAQVHPYLLDCIELFGIDRCFFGSNFPVESLYIGYQSLMEKFAKILVGLTAAEARLLFFENAKKLYQIEDL